MSPLMLKNQRNTLSVEKHGKPFKKKPQIKVYRSKQKSSNEENLEIVNLIQNYEKIEPSSIQNFSDFPLCKKTQIALKKVNYQIPTEIQRESIGLALKGLDILGAAKTGSGKTLAFLIPILECLYRERWTTLDGLGALVITPTRELAYQIFEVLRKIGWNHDFSAGLIIGGKDLKFERKRMDRCNIVICTPGRLLQHMDENPLFCCSNLKVLVLDEADKILDLGFQKTVNAIIEHLPSERQTLLFSATQTKSVKDLARLSLKNPVYVSAHEHAKYSTPESLQQSYIVCDLHDKIDLMWSFLKSHRKQKILVFLSSCKQVKYIYDAFCRMRPGLSVMALYGTLHQLRRMAIYDDFCKKKHAVLFATDIASRGLDFPSVNWVVQFDCPEDTNTYIHRAGRTARYQEGGEALLVLTPSEEESMVEQLQARNIPINKISVNPKRFVSVQKKLEILCARDVALKESAQRAFKAYLKSVFLMKDKKVFNIQKLDNEAFARSLGLAIAPKIRFIKKQLQLQELKDKKEFAKKASSQIENTVIGSKEESEESSEEDILIPKSPSKMAYHFPSDDSDGDLLTVKRTINYKLENHSSDEMKSPLPAQFDEKKDKALTKAALAKRVIKKKIKANKKVVFNDEGEVVEDFPTMQKASVLKECDNLHSAGFNLELAKKIMSEEDKFDKELYRQRIRAKHREQRLKLKEERRKKKAEQESKPKIVEHEEEGSSSEDDEPPSELIASLPDPDRIYGKQESSANDASDTDNESKNLSIKRQRHHSKDRNKPSKKAKYSKSSNNDYEDKPPDTGLTLAEDEDLALHLLNT